MTETALFLPNGAYSLFGMLHAPGPADERSAFVFCHPFGEEKLWAHRVYVTFARRLAELGHPVLRFDYFGNGDSDGDFSAASLATIRSDVRAAIAYLKDATGVQRVSLLGLRLGATVASLVAEEMPGLDRLVLWAPIIDGARYMQELLRINLTTQMAAYKEVRQDREELVRLLEQGRTVNVDGYEMGHSMFSEVSAVKLAAAPKRFSGPCLVVNVDRQAARPAPELQQLASSYAHASLAAAQEEPFWKEISQSYQKPAANLFEATTHWLTATGATPC